MAKLTTASITDRLASLGSERWELHYEARRRIEAGEDLIELTIGEPDVPTPAALVDVAFDAMKAGRTRYSGGRGEPGMLEAVAEKYARRTGRVMTQDHVLAMPGTQAALTIVMMALAESGDGILVPDPYYATYEGVVHTTGARFQPVAMSKENGFHLTADQLEQAITPQSKVLLLNSPHNPTGAVLSPEEIRAIGDVCRKHNLWIVSDEVYEELIYDGEFASPFDVAELADQVIVCSSISKSHAAPGFRSGWCVGSPDVISKVQSIAEAILFGGQPFIADMTEHALRRDDETVKVMGRSYQKRIALLQAALADSPSLQPLAPASGMFMLVDVSATGLTGEAFARGLLNHGVGVMPGSAFGKQAQGFVRLSLTVPDETLKEAARRMAQYAQNL